MAYGTSMWVPGQRLVRQVSLEGASNRSPRETPWISIDNPTEKLGPLTRSWDPPRGELSRYVRFS